MNEKLFKEYIDRVGIVNRSLLEQQAGLERRSLFQPVENLVKQREIFLCRLDHGEETLLSRHLLFCLRAVFSEPVLSQKAQEIYDCLCDNELTSESTLAQQVSGKNGQFKESFKELQKKLCIAPLVFIKPTGRKSADTSELEEDSEILWVTVECWVHGLHRPNRYSNLAYCLSEVRRLMGMTFTSGELNQLIYHGEM